jgi:hypothetical protein
MLVVRYVFLTSVAPASRRLSGEHSFDFALNRLSPTALEVYIRRQQPN